jgi:hypothetical protein
MSDNDRKFKVDPANVWADRIEIAHVTSTGRKTIYEADNEPCSDSFLSEKLTQAFSVVDALESFAHDEWESHLKNEFHIVIKTMHFLGDSDND